MVSVFSFRFLFVTKLGGIGHAIATQMDCEHSYCTLVKSDLPSAGALPPWIY